MDATTAEFVRKAKETLEARGKLAPCVDAYANLRGCSRQAAYSLLARHGVQQERQPRSDRGRSKVPPADTLTVGALIAHSARRDARKMDLPVSVAVEALVAEGAVAPASPSTYRRQLAAHSLDAASRRAPAPHAILRSERPNACWQVDASQALQWYLIESRLVLDRARAAEEYKIEVVKRRDGVLKRYIVTDHFSSAFWVHYAYAPGERPLDFLRAVWEAMRYKGESFPLGGIPALIYCDAGAMRAAAVKQAMDALGVRVEHHLPGRPNATGQVERRHGHWEAQFEVLLAAQGRTKFSLDELNQLAFETCQRWNASKRVGRLGESAFASYSRHILREAVVYPPEWEIVLEMARGLELSRKLGRDWYIQWSPRTGEKFLYSLRHLSGETSIQPGKQVAFTPSHDATQPDWIVVITPDGKRWEIAPEAMALDGRPLRSAVLGVEFKGAPDDIATTQRKLALATPLPAPPARDGAVVALHAQRPAEPAQRMVPRLAWMEQYSAFWGVALAEAGAVYAARYGEAAAAPEAEAGVEQTQNVQTERKSS